MLTHRVHFYHRVVVSHLIIAAHVQDAAASAQSWDTAPQGVVIHPTLTHTRMAGLQELVPVPYFDVLGSAAAEGAQPAGEVTPLSGQQSHVATIHVVVVRQAPHSHTSTRAAAGTPAQATAKPESPLVVGPFSAPASTAALSPCVRSAAPLGRVSEDPHPDLSHGVQYTKFVQVANAPPAWRF